MDHVGETDIIRFMQFMFKPTLACNLACKYCHIHSRRDASHEVISLNEAKDVFNWILSYCLDERINRVNILWHGGEPLLLKPALITAIVEYYTGLFSRNNISVSSSIQTNLLLFSDDHIPIVQKYFDNTVGFSFDFNSDDRCYRDGSDASGDIWRKALELKSLGINLGAITQITKSNHRRVEEIYNTFKEGGISFKFSRIRETDIFKESLSNDDYVEAVTKLFVKWVEDPSQSITISNFVEFISMLLTGKASSCCYQKDCNILSFTCDGSIFFCDRSFEAGSIGNIYIDSPSQVKSNVIKSIKKGVAVPSGCGTCKYKQICNFGCLFNRISGWHKYECVSFYRILEFISDYLVARGYNVIYK